VPLSNRDRAKGNKNHDETTAQTGHTTVIPKRLPNAALRNREYLTDAEVTKLIAAAKGNVRDVTMILVAYRHGLRASELVDLRWSQVDFRSATLHVRRVKKGKPASHPIQGDTMRLLRQLHRDRGSSEFVFTSERGGPFIRKDSPVWSSAPVAKLDSISRRIRICCAMAAAMP
jgi:integrase